MWQYCAQYSAAASSALGVVTRSAGLLAPVERTLPMSLWPGPLALIEYWFFWQAGKLAHALRLCAACRGLDALDGSPSQRRTDQEGLPELYGMSPGSNATESLDLSLGMGGGTASRSQVDRGTSNWLDDDDDDATTVVHSEL